MLMAAALASLRPAVRSEVLAWSDLPPCNADMPQGQGGPAAVERVCERIRSADGMLLVTPEYNHSLPGMLKNALD